MKQHRFPRLMALLAFLFEQPASPNYALRAIFFLAVGMMVVFLDNQVPGLLKHLVMLATMFGIARFFNYSLLRWFWVSAVSIFGIALALDVFVLMLAH